MVTDSTTFDHSYVPGRTLDKATLADRVYQSLREDILSNRLLPGTPLQQAAVAAALDVSRGPVRDALRRLGAEGLVTLSARRGAVVSSLTRAEFLDNYRVREALEVLAIRLATPTLDSEDLKELERLHQVMVQHAEAEEVEAFFSVNAVFHKLIVERSANVVLQQIYPPLANHMRRYRLSSVLLRGGLMRSCQEHARILEAVKAGLAEQAAHLLSEHIRVPQQILESDSEADLVPNVLTPGQAS